MNSCRSCGDPLVRSDTFCPSCGTHRNESEPKEHAVVHCGICNAEASIMAYGLLRCWSCYYERMDAAEMDWREKAIREHAKSEFYKPRKDGETLGQYMRRVQGVQQLPAAEQYAVPEQSPAQVSACTCKAQGTCDVCLGWAGIL